MISFRAGKAVKTSTVDFDRVLMIRNEAVLAAAEVDSSLLFINLIDRTHVPITVRDLLDQLAVSTVVIDMPPAAAIAKPKKRTIFQIAQTIVYDFNPSLTALAKRCRRLPVIRIGSI